MADDFFPAPTDTGPPSLAQGLYGETGPISGGPADPRVAALIDAGKARTAGEPAPTRPALFGGDQPRQPEETATRVDLFEPGRFKLPDGYEPGGMFPEFASLARELKLNQRDGERALDLYRRSIETEQDHYAQSLEANVDRLSRELPAEDVRMVNQLINDSYYTPPAMKDWILKWGAHEGVATMLTRWASAIRQARRY
jgi:hypothetical protein